MAERLDLYDENRRGTGQILLRGEAVPEGRYFLCVSAWIVNARGEYLLTRRHPNKSHPLKWECTGGCVRAGEDSLSAAVREVWEETGVRLSPEGGRRILRLRRDARRDFYDVWLFYISFDPPLRLQADEVVGAKWVSRMELECMRRSGELNPLIDDLAYLP